MRSVELVVGRSQLRRIQARREHRNRPESFPSRLTSAACRKLVFARLQALRGARLTVQEGDRSHTFGENGNAELRACIRVQHPRFYRRLVAGGGLGAARALIEDDWTCDDLTALVRIFTRNLATAEELDRGMARIRQWLARLVHGWRKNHRRGARKNIHAHYDLGNDFFSLFLDDTLSYSCAYFERPEATLHEASVAKLERVCHKLELRPEDHLLEIGTGWGGLALHAAREFGCRVTTTTISQEQFQYARQRVQEAGLADRVSVLKQDYRDLRGQFDKLVSIEMIEAVGHEYFGTFFRRCGALLKAEGTMLLQSIVIHDSRYEAHLRSVDFIRHYIFPGGCLPSTSVLTRTAADAADMHLVHLENLAAHYAETLRRWRSNFEQRLMDIRSLGFDESFIRVWRYYLCYCEAVFEERQVQDVQMVFAKRGSRADRLPGEQVTPSTRNHLVHPPATTPALHAPQRDESSSTMAWRGTRA